MGSVPPQATEIQEIPPVRGLFTSFRHLKELHKKGRDEERLGRDGEHFRKLYKQMAKLDDLQTSQLDQIASETADEVEKLNARAMRDHQGDQEHSTQTASWPQANCHLLHQRSSENSQPAPRRHHAGT
jgi:hypothetical protein